MSPSGRNGAATAKGTDGAELKATEAMCCHCFDTLSEELKGKAQGSSWKSSRRGRSAIPPDFVKDLSNPSIECPLFVTWEKVRPKAGFPANLLGGGNDTGEPVYELRGCIGSLSPKKLSAAIGDYALTSALKDRRFQPVKEAEIPSLRVAVSLLVQYEPCQNCFDWVVGTHGILIRFWSFKASREYSATYLPEVAQEQGWDQKTSVVALMRKSGYTGKIDQELFDAIDCTRYQSSKVRMTYDEFLRLKPKVDNSPPSTEPPSASSSLHHTEEQQMYDVPMQKWNTCNNL